MALADASSGALSFTAARWTLSSVAWHGQSVELVVSLGRHAVGSFAYFCRATTSAERSLSGARARGAALFAGRLLRSIEPLGTYRS